MSEMAFYYNLPDPAWRPAQDAGCAKYLVASYFGEHATDYGSEPSETVKKKPFAHVKTQPT